MLAYTDEISGKLSRGEARSLPFRYRFAFLLISFLHHQTHRLLLAHVPSVNALIENGVGDSTQPHLQLLHLHLRSSVVLFRHHLFAIYSPALDERAAPKNSADQGRRAELVSM